jgi:hypothetical protein
MNKNSKALGIESYQLVARHSIRALYVVEGERDFSRSGQWLVRFPKVGDKILAYLEVSQSDHAIVSLEVRNRVTLFCDKVVRLNTRSASSRRLGDDSDAPSGDVTVQLITEALSTHHEWEHAPVSLELLDIADNFRSVTIVASAGDPDAYPEYLEGEYSNKKNRAYRAV